MPYVVVRDVTFRGETQRRTLDVPGDRLRIGRGTSNDLRLEDLAVSLNHAIITQETDGRYRLVDLTKTGATYVNRVPVMEKELKDGDRIRISHYELHVSIPDPDSPLTVLIEEGRRDRDTLLIALMPKYRLAGGRWSQKSLTIALTLLIISASGLAFGIGKHRFFMPGPVSLKHAQFADQCGSCHTSWKAVWNVVPDKTCQTCHLGPPHFRDHSLVPSPQCASCHIEHKGLAILAAVPDAKCVQCHGDLQAKEPTFPVAARIHSFSVDHPEFAVSLSSPKQKIPARVRLNETTLLKDGGRLKLNHKLHMEPELAGPDGPESLKCTSCHRLDEPGRYMRAIQYETDCMRCHTLDFDSRLPGKTVSHGRQPEKLRNELQEIYAGFYLRSYPGEAKAATMMRRLPGQPPTPQEQFIDERTARAERFLYMAKGKKCLLCHETESNQSGAMDPPSPGPSNLTPEPVSPKAGEPPPLETELTQSATVESSSSVPPDMAGPEPATPKAIEPPPRESPSASDSTDSDNQPVKREEKKTIKTTDEESQPAVPTVIEPVPSQPQSTMEPPSPTVKPEPLKESLDKSQPERVLPFPNLPVIAKVNVPKRWLPFSTFDHAAHYNVPLVREKGCVACHEMAPKSVKTEDILLPGVQSCRACHFEPGGAQAGCNECHVYHDKTLGPQIERLSPPIEPKRDQAVPDSGRKKAEGAVGD